MEFAPYQVLSSRPQAVRIANARSGVQDSDPENLIGKTAEDGQRITDELLDASLKRAFDSGIFTLSEIAFDKEHHRAAVSYSFFCGRLCGNGHTLLLKKVENHWLVAKRCGGWIS